MNKDICIIGIDGTGKTTLCKLLKKELGREENIAIRYMGYHDFLTPFAKKYLSSDKRTKCFLLKIRNFIIIYYEMIWRFYCERKNVDRIIFDRYVWESYLSDRRIRNFLYKFTYLFYPKPRYCFYLTCDESVSIERKDDIITEKDRELLHRNKVKYDSYFIRKEWIYTIDTTNFTIQEVLDIVKHELEKGDEKEC